METNVQPPQLPCCGSAHAGFGHWQQLKALVGVVVGVFVRVRVGVLLAVAVAVLVGVFVRVCVGVRVGVLVKVGVGVLVCAAVGPAYRLVAPASNTLRTMARRRPLMKQRSLTMAGMSTQADGKHTPIHSRAALDRRVAAC